MDIWHEEDLIRCKVRTAQFVNGEIHHWHVQEGSVEEGVWIFKPDSFTNGNHIVNFRTKEAFEEAKINE